MPVVWLDLVWMRVAKAGWDASERPSSIVAPSSCASMRSDAPGFSLSWVPRANLVSRRPPQSAPPSSRAPSSRLPLSRAPSCRHSEAARDDAGNGATHAAMAAGAGGAMGGLIGEDVSGPLEAVRESVSCLNTWL